MKNHGKSHTIDIEIDSLTNSIVDTKTNQSLATKVVPATEKELEVLERWQFNWKSESRENDVYKLALEDSPRGIQGLIGLSNEGDHILVTLIEKAPSNMGKNPSYLGVAGNLFAYACKRAFELGYDGFVAFIAKTNLIEHYVMTLGAEQLGRSNKMIIGTHASQILVNQYYGNII